MRENWATLWEAVSDAMPDAVAVVHGERRLTYREVEQRAARLAAALPPAAGTERRTHEGGGGR